MMTAAFLDIEVCADREEDLQALLLELNEEASYEDLKAAA